MSENHEFGHIIGWHDMSIEDERGGHDTRGGDNIMAPKNTVSDPKKRTVKQSDIDKTVGRAKFKNKKSQIGQVRRKNLITDKDGNFIN